MKKSFEDIKALYRPYHFFLFHRFSNEAMATFARGTYDLGFNNIVRTLFIMILIYQKGCLLHCYMQKEMLI